jgi:uncharacterized protein YoxC
MIDEILTKFNLKYEDLNRIERETLNTWMEALEKGQLSVSKIKDYVTSMKESVEAELTKHDLGSKQDLYLKARLRNYMLLDAFLSTPERAKQQMESALSSIVKRGD